MRPKPPPTASAQGGRTLTLEERLRLKFGSKFDLDKFKSYERYLRKRWFVKRAAERRLRAARMTSERLNWRKDLWLAPKKEDDLEPV
jgi:hypothetical protein